MSTAELLERTEQARVGVLGFVTSQGRPSAVAITPYVVEGRAVVTSTLALVDKAAALRHDPRVTLTAGGIAVTATATVQVDPSPYFFDRHIRHQELAKYPPSRSLLSLPFHRRLLDWYVGRVVIWIQPDTIAEQPVGDWATVSVLDHDGRLRTWSVPMPGDLQADQIALPVDVAGGPAVLLAHEEDPDMRDLRQLALHGVVDGSTLRVERRRGTLEPSRRGTWDELMRLRALARRARANRARLAAWPHVDRQMS